jgi:hypothetical protein
VGIMAVADSAATAASPRTNLRNMTGLLEFGVGAPLMCPCMSVDFSPEWVRGDACGKKDRPLSRPVVGISVGWSADQ